MALVLNNICLYFFLKWVFLVDSGKELEFGPEVKKDLLLAVSAIFKVLELPPQTPRKEKIS